MHHEKKVAERLDKMGIENFVPVQQEVHQWSDRRKVVESVLLPMMVFVHAVSYTHLHMGGFVQIVPVHATVNILYSLSSFPHLTSTAGSG